jgi:hypothetical protein
MSVQLEQQQDDDDDDDDDSEEEEEDKEEEPCCRVGEEGAAGAWACLRALGWLPLVQGAVTAVVKRCVVWFGGEFSCLVWAIYPPVLCSIFSLVCVGIWTTARDVHVTTTTTTTKPTTAIHLHHHQPPNTHTHTT